MSTTFNNFIAKYGNYAKAAAAGTPIFAETILTAAAAESSYGKSQLSAKYNNFFGIKADPSWKGKKIVFSTKEQKKDGSVYVVQAAFRHYDTPAESFINYVKFISGPRYVKAGVTTAKNPQEQFKKIQAAGYATDIKYSEKLISIFNGIKDWTKAYPIAAAATTGTATALLFFLHI